MKVGVIQHNPVIGDFAGNVEMLLHHVEALNKEGATLCLAPAWALCGYDAGKLLGQDSFIENCRIALHDFVEQHAAAQLPPVILGTVLATLHDAHAPAQHVIVLVENGQYLIVGRKSIVLSGLRRGLQVLPSDSCGFFWRHGKRYVVAFSEDVFGFCGANTDSLAPDMLKKHIDGHDVAGVFLLGALPFSQGVQQQLDTYVNSFAATYQTALFWANLTGGSGSNILCGGSFAATLQAKCIHQLPFFTPGHICVKSSGSSAATGFLPLSDTELTWQALVTGTRDFVHRSGFSAVVLGLSGGIDSALTAAIAVEALGAEHVVAIMLPSAYSSKSSITDSLVLAKNLGITTYTVPIAKVVDAYKETLADVFPPGASGVTEENLQSRARGDFLMAYSNQFGAMLLTTGNKSELAVGYCTLYGDMCGGLAVLADVYKTQVYALSAWCNNSRTTEWIPQAIIDKAPSAELRPGQKDSDSLPPYDILDAILYELIEKGTSATTLIHQKIADAEVVRHIEKLYVGAEFKRRQAAPSLCVSQHPFMPETWLPSVRYKGNRTS